MFSGIVQQIAKLRECESHATARKMRFAYREATIPPLELGSSVCINGVCLTVASMGKDYFDADVSAETIACSTLGTFSVGQLLNMESAICMETPLGGHMLTGHVDAIATVDTIEEEATSKRFGFVIDVRYQDICRYIAHKGSVAVDGVSLTVNAVNDHGFEVNIVPHTMQHTIFEHYKLGAAVNIEVDLLARYVARWLETSKP